MNIPNTIRRLRHSRVICNLHYINAWSDRFSFENVFNQIGYMNKRLLTSILDLKLIYRYNFRMSDPIKELQKMVDSLGVPDGITRREASRFGRVHKGDQVTERKLFNSPSSTREQSSDGGENEVKISTRRREQVNLNQISFPTFMIKTTKRLN